ncbi:MAG TPA: protocatechuate 4,5-dioxygenase subunit alpha [Rhizomicrobium sp.]|nr:protocatechuate 4,5-dioxygenase subunit alpha [Rhizomicrobium sp.]
MGGEFSDIPGTVLFDAKRARQGYWLNNFCMSLMAPANRAAFKADEAGYLKGYAMSDEQRTAVKTRDWNTLLALGGNIYCLAKIGATDGKSFQQIAAEMTGMTPEEYARMMLSGGRSIDGHRSVSESGHG